MRAGLWAGRWLRGYSCLKQVLFISFPLGSCFGQDKMGELRGTEEREGWQEKGLRSRQGQQGVGKAEARPE